MANKGVVLVIVNSFLIHLIFTFDLPSYLINNLYPISKVIAGKIGIGVSLLLYPLFGLLADVYMTRYKMILGSLLILAILLIFTSISAFIFTTIPVLIDADVPQCIATVGSALILACMIACVGIFEANAIQFGTDQLMDASSTQLSAFIHWYFWIMHLGQHILFCTSFIYAFVGPKLQFSQEESRLRSGTSLIVFVLVWMSGTITSLYVLHHAKRSMYVAKVGMNPLKQTWTVLNFARKNRYPLNRSAFTYCEENVPSRIDFGKVQYGGPFTTEEVEDVKSFLRLLLLLVTLFGYDIAGDGFAVAHHMEQYSCPSLPVWEILIHPFCLLQLY